ncbi:hypothetical protein HAX54_014380 [Datura stramonium]|uniref:Uncharacterized protein n=1 Tax=Datura stramonium TaxID=4076 RepID=A0ABS8TP16_DATST|nr:hypothetical protein [Datura stramonium]
MADPNLKCLDVAMAIPSWPGSPINDTLGALCGEDERIWGGLDEDEEANDEYLLEFPPSFLFFIFTLGAMYSSWLRMVCISLYWSSIGLCVALVGAKLLALTVDY